MLLTLNKLESFKYAPETSGIYYLLYMNTVVYVGQSKNLRNRLSNHYRAKTQLNKLKNNLINDKQKLITSYKLWAMYYLIDTDLENWKYICLEYPLEELNEMEEAHIEFLQPRFNTMGVDKPYAPYIREKKSFIDNLILDDEGKPIGFKEETYGTIQM